MQFFAKTWNCLSMLEKTISSSGEQPFNTELEEQYCLNSLLKTRQRAFSISGFNYSCSTTALSTALLANSSKQHNDFLTVGYTSGALFFHWATMSALSHGWWYRYCLEENLHSDSWISTARCSWRGATVSWICISREKISRHFNETLKVQFLAS